MESDFVSSESDDDNNRNESFASSVGVSLNLPSGSLKTSIKDQRKALKVVSVFPRSEAAFKAVLDLVSVCKAIEAQLEQISFQRLDFGELCALDQFYTADIVIVDASQVKEQPTLFYHLGIRESFGMKDNVVIVHDDDETKTSSIQISSSNYHFLAYIVNKQGRCFVSRNGHRNAKEMTACKPLVMLFRKLLTNIEGCKRAMCKEYFLRDLRNTREKLCGKELKKELNRMKRLLGDPTLFTADIIINLLLSYREIQDYSSMVQLIEDLPPNHKETKNKAVQQHYAFALNRRNNAGDRDKAIGVVTMLLQTKENHAPDTLGLCGRIYKDQFIDSGYKDTDHRDQAVIWYRKAFELQPNQYAGMNLAILLVASGQLLNKSEELQRVCMMLNSIIGRKGSLTSLKEFWDVAVFFGVSILAQDYGKACQAAECMFKLKPPSWYLKSLLTDIRMIEEFRPRDELNRTPIDEMYDFWMDYLVEASKDKSEDLRFPVLLLELGNVFVPSYIALNLDTADEAVRIWNVGAKDNEQKIDQWTFSRDSIKGLSSYKLDDRSMFLYVTENSDDFQFFFSTPHHRQRFHDVVMRMSTDCSCLSTEHEGLSEPDDDIQYECERDERNERVILGKGTFGVVYAARELITQVKIAVKEVPEKDKSHVQPLHEEITLHRQFSHRNIVQYLGSRSEDGVFKIFMEQVPGGSLSSLIRSKWGPLLNNEGTVAFYTKQILQGVKYLHAQKVVHRDIKGDNVLVNTYSGACKLTDFGTSKRLAGINPVTKTFTGTMQFMAPEVIDHGQRGYGPPADIWSVGCTAIEMITGKPPFFELEPAAAIFKVGMFKTHPDIPESLSDELKDFLMRCFEPDPTNRATAEELLGHSFLARKGRKKHSNMKLIIPKHDNKDQQDGRITADSGFEATASSDSFSPKDLFPTTPFTPSPPRSPHANDTSSFDQEPNGTKIKRISRSLTLPSRKSDDSLTSTGSLSPSSLTNSFDNSQQKRPGKDIFFQVKQESERRNLVIDVMNQNIDQICNSWMSKLEHMSSVSMLTLGNLKVLVNCVKEYIEEKNEISIKDYLGPIESVHGGQPKLFHEIQIALHMFQESVSEVISKHRKVLPHWMFAVDNMVRIAVSRTLEDLTREMRDKLKTLQSVDENEFDTSTHTSQDMENEAKTVTFAADKWTSERNPLIQKINQLSEENIVLMRELVNAQDTLKKVLSSNIANHTSLIDSYKSTNAHSAVGRRRSSFSSCRKVLDPIGDLKLESWLRDLDIPKSEIDKFARQHCTYDDVLRNFSLDDLKDVELSIGPRNRVWKAVQRFRSAPAVV
eukprot:Seg1622.17 transcript_id=Seg1622.17/GoldUCD/mRNA.D3Y31 product="Mitogen-activated protein kinase kinase kinase 15" protein_id=Seg1622.17/GoldUCD/D3Y31